MKATVIKKFAALGACLLLTACASVKQPQQSLYTGNPEINYLPAGVINSPIFNKDAPKPNVEMLTYESTEIATQKKFSRYQIHLLETKGVITRYRTREVDPRDKGFFVTPGLPIIRGDGVGYGGIFMLAYEKGHYITGQPITKEDYYKKYLMTSITNVQGHLFPLAVGNKLTFDYTDMDKNKRTGDNLPDHFDSGKMVYQVLAKEDGYKESKHPVPGDVYLIRVSKTTKEDPRLMPQYEYYFSTSLGWYIKARYYRDGKVVAIYRLRDWEK